MQHCTVCLYCNIHELTCDKLELIFWLLIVCVCVCTNIVYIYTCMCSKTIIEPAHAKATSGLKYWTLYWSLSCTVRIIYIICIILFFLATAHDDRKFTTTPLSHDLDMSTHICRMISTTRTATWQHSPLPRLLGLAYRDVVFALPSRFHRVPVEDPLSRMAYKLSWINTGRSHYLVLLAPLLGATRLFHVCWLPVQWGPLSPSGKKDKYCVRDVANLKHWALCTSPSCTVKYYVLSIML